MFTVQRVMDKFLKGEVHQEASIRTDGDNIYSYDVLVAYRQENTVKVNTAYFSSTTTRHVNAILRELLAHNSTCTPDKLLHVDQVKFELMSVKQERIEEDKDYNSLFLDEQTQQVLEEKMGLLVTQTLFALQHKTKQAKNVKLIIRERKVLDLMQEMIKKVTLAQG